MAEEGVIVVQSTQQLSNRDERGKFKPGFSGNPGGRPKGFLTSIMYDILKKDGNQSENIIKKLLEMALSGDIAAIKEILDRIEGKSVMKAEVKTVDAPKSILETYVPTNDSNQEIKGVE
ncbi:MAG: hypothetical protein UU51_C0035G0006 [Microgenomates group bacterium GW2011_GWC1_41_20]|nr:MAG: hypothetical protein UU51_C0035G0006 [Microgenomates group bacterium GW2011_GWC1_41_20]